ncbi:MAG: 16S rRNA (uracil(1498)-N(3))-methyltransferase [Candidatus Omnitrophota bacterium]|nr:16S rRNA (uracil(1498)-N(3))-methyltransferase [Candidatus Omnitrophota bacterium]
MKPASRFYVSPENIGSSEIWISGKEAHHIIDVMRLAPGDEVVVFDGEGKEYEGIIKQESGQSVLIKINSVKRLVKQKLVKIILAQAIPRKARMDYLVQKCTELGVEQIIPLSTGRTVVKLNGSRLASRCQRWQRIAVEASKQCGRIRISRIREVSSFKKVIGQIKSYDLALIPCLDKQGKSLKKVLAVYKRTGSAKSREIIIFIGPEGGFTPEEIRMAREAGAVLVSLGESILKSDTAAVASIAIVDYELRL